MNTTRRKLLKSNLTAVSLGFVGYSSGQAKASSDHDSAPAEGGHEMSTEIRLELEPVSLSQSERESIDPVVFNERSEPEQEKLQTAIETTRSVDEIGNESEATLKIREAIEKRTDDGPQVFVTRGNSYFATRFVVGEHIIANPDETPPKSAGK